MAKIEELNSILLPKKHKRRLSAGVRSVRNSFYEPESHHGPYLTGYHGVYVENHFGIRFSGEGREEDRIRQRPLLE